MNNILLKYVIFSAISSLINLAFQYLIFYLFNGFLVLYVSMFFGTLVGLVLKYILDKNFIFYHLHTSMKNDGKKFILYSFVGIFTTLIFCGFEISFNNLFSNKNAKYFGAALGLSIGYIIRYFLDKKFVFTN